VVICCELSNHKKGITCKKTALIKLLRLKKRQRYKNGINYKKNISRQLLGLAEKGRCK
jgi:hypothetical protein